jgi:hypothetical protein
MNYAICIVFLLLFPLASVDSFSTLPVVGTNERRRSCFGHICNEKKRTVYEYYYSPRKLSPILGSSIKLWAKFLRKKDDNSFNNGDDDDTGNTARLPGSNFFRRSGPRSDCNSNSKNARSINTVVKNGSTYVPSGLSRAEYSELKSRETGKERNMDFGAWGPRFARGGPPRGDWMAMPNLWTMGNIGMNNNSNNKNNNDHSNRLILLYRRLQLIIRGYGPAFLLGYVFIDCLYSGYAVWRFKQIRYVSILSFIIGLRPVQQQIIQPAIIKIATKSVTVVSLTVLKLNVLKIVLAMLQIPLWNILMEGANRRWLWSKRRFVVVVGSAVTAALTLFGRAMLR